MALTLSTPQYAMVGNPVVATMQNTDAAQVVYLEVACGDIAFSDSYTLAGLLHVNVAELLQTAVTSIPQPVAGTEVLKVVRTNPIATITLKNSQGAVVATKTCTLLWGGYGEDLLAERNTTSGALVESMLLGSAPFMTARTTGSAITMCQAELQPLYFITAAGEEASVEITNSRGEKQTYAADAGPSRLFALDMRLLVNLATMYLKIKLRTCTVHVSITQTPVTTQQRIATFLNSYGVYERMLLTGQGQHISTLAESEEGGNISRFNTATQLFERQSQPRAVTDSITLYAGYKSREDLALINALVMSRHILLDGRQVLCKATELIPFTDTDTREPREVELPFEYAVTRYHHTPR